jgi:hypothetical protein
MIQNMTHIKKKIQIQNIKLKKNDTKNHVKKKTLYKIYKNLQIFL